MSGSGTITPTVPGAAPTISGDGYNSFQPYTLLSLTRYAQIIGLDPIQFFGGQTSLRSLQNCSDVWYQYRWQDGQKISREEVNYAIAQAELDLATEIGYWMAPVWIADELHDYPQYYVKEYRGRYGYAAGGFTNKQIKTDWGRVICGGQRAYTQIDSSDYTRSADVDTTGDTFADMAVFTINNVDFDICELEAYYKAYNPADAPNCRTDPESTGADRYWQIKDIRVKYNSSTQQAIVYVPIWQLFKPQLQREINAGVIDADDSDSYVDTLEFYRVYNDPSAPVQFLWANEVACSTAACAWATQTGCMRVSDRRNGLVNIQPATYDSTTNAFTTAAFSQNIEPDKARLWYYAGYIDPNKRGCHDLSHWWAITIAMLATARLNKQVCACENVARIAVEWQEDTAKNTTARTYITQPDLNNPFGTKVGEVGAWRRLKTLSIRKGRAVFV